MGEKGEPLWDKPGGQGDAIQDHIQAERYDNLHLYPYVAHWFSHYLLELCYTVNLLLLELTVCPESWNPEGKLGAVSVSHIMKFLYGAEISPYSYVRWVLLLEMGQYSNEWDDSLAES